MKAQLHAKKRDLKVKTKTLRQQGWIPAAVSGGEMNTLHLQLPLKEVQAWAKSGHAKTDLYIEGMKEMQVSVKEIQHGNLGNQWLHISFYQLRSDVKTSMEIPIVYTGKSLGQMDGGMNHFYLDEVTVYGFPKDIPEKIVVDISTLKIGDSIHLSDIVKNYPCEFEQDDLEKMMVKCEHLKVLKDEEPVANTEAESAAIDENPVEAEEKKEDTSTDAA